MSEKVCLSVNNKVATIMLNRPDSLNALDNDMIADFISFLEACKLDATVRVIVIEGSGRAFCAGDDLVDMGTSERPNPEDKLTEYKNGYPALVQQIRSVEKPVICKVQKYALGAGFEIAMASDIVIAEEDAKFGLPFVLRGIAAGTFFLQSYIGYHKACEYLFTGDMIPARKAEDFGIVNKVVPLTELDKEVDKMALRLSTGATRAMGLIKQTMNNSANVTLETAMQEQALATTVSYYTKDFAEGKSAFVEKRESNFIGK